MDDHYTKIKNDLGLPEMQKALKNEQDGMNDDAVKLDEILARLRPNTTAANFKEFLERQDNINKSSHWKRISRKVHPTVSNCVSQYISQSSTKESTQLSPQGSPIGGKFLNIMSSEHIISGPIAG